MPKNRPGYHLPSGDLGDDDITCQLVYLPDRPEYWQAFLAAYHYMTTWVAWEADSDKRGKDAASNWREAFEMTMECWRMPCLDEIKALLIQLIAAQCCGSNIFTQIPSPLAPNTGTEIVYQEGSPPAEYGDAVISTWDDWVGYKCEAVHLLVEEVALKFEQLGNLQSDYDAEDVTVEMIGWIVSKLTPLLVFINLAWDVFQAITGIGWELIGDFSGAAAEIRAAADDIVCQVSKGDGARDTAERFEAACKDEVSSTFGDLILSGMPWEAWANIIYTGVAVDNEGNEVYLTDVLEPPGTNNCCGPVKILVVSGDNLTGYNPFSFDSELVLGGAQPDWESAAARFRNFDDTGFIECNLLSISGAPTPSNDGAGATYELYDIDGNLVHNSDTPPTLPMAIRSFVVRDQRATGSPAPTPFVLTGTWEVT